MKNTAKQLNDEEKIRNEILALESKEELENEEKILNRLKALQKKVDERTKRKSNALKQAQILTKNAIAKVVLNVLKMEDDYDKCEKLSDYDNIKERVEKNLKFYFQFYNANKNLPGIRTPIIDEGKNLKSEEN